MPIWKVHEEVEKITGCDHTHTRATRATKSNGVTCVYIQCIRCGWKVKEVSKKEYNVSILPAFDEKLRESWRHRIQETYARMRDQWNKEYEKERAEQDKEFWVSYSAYLRSEHWQRLREMVIERDNFKCQNCFDPVAFHNAHVHHTSYVGFQRLGHSFAFECVTLCRSCHEKWHDGLDRQR